MTAWKGGRGWILDTGAVHTMALRTGLGNWATKVEQQGRRLVIPQHVLMEVVRQESDYYRVDSAQLYPQIEEELQGVTLLSFAREDGATLLRWLQDRKISWQVEKLKAAVDGAWLPFREVLLDQPCPACQRALRRCGCEQKFWDKEDQGALKDKVRSYCTHAADTSTPTHSTLKNAHASATIDWLTVAMALRHDLVPVTNERGGKEWAGIHFLNPQAFRAEVQKL